MHTHIPTSLVSDNNMLFLNVNIFFVFTFSLAFAECVDQGKKTCFNIKKIRAPNE